MGEGILTAGFERAAGTLRCDGVSLDAIAQQVGTPTYVYSATAIRDQYRRLDGALASVPHRIHYSVKANSNLGILALLRELGAGLDVVSGGELYRAAKAGFGGADVVFGGVGKTESELRAALEAGVLLVNVESEGELRLLDDVAERIGRVAPVALRVNPEVTVETPHPYTRTGERASKFGIPYDEALRVARLVEALPHTELRGLDMHVGSQVTELGAYIHGLGKLMELYRALRGQAPGVEYLDIGGGLAVTYDEDVAPDLDRYGEAVAHAVAGTTLRVIVEPGRFLVANAGVLLARVLYRKRSGGADYVITDAAMTDLLRPSHYNAFHQIDAVTPRGSRARASVVGPVCESGDFFALDREMDELEPGDLIAIRSAGAYGYAMSSNYNSRPRSAEVLVDGERFALVTDREQYADLVRLEHSTPQWRTV